MTDERFDSIEQRRMPCGTCGLKMVTSKAHRCDACYEVESRLRDYLASSPGAVIFVEGELSRVTMPPGSAELARAMVKMWKRLAEIREHAEKQLRKAGRG